MAVVGIVQLNSGPAGPGAVLIRYVFHLIDSLPVAFVPGLVCVGPARRLVCIGDITASTLPVHESQAAAAEGPQEISAVALVVPAR